jgi:hypothetical protein
MKYLSVVKGNLAVCCAPPVVEMLIICLLQMDHTLVSTPSTPSPIKGAISMSPRTKGG